MKINIILRSGLRICHACGADILLCNPWFCKMVQSCEITPYNTDKFTCTGRRLEVNYHFNKSSQ